MMGPFTYANTMATIAVFIALGGTAAATGVMSGVSPSRSAHSAAGASLFANDVSGAAVKGEGHTTATADCPSGQVPIAGSDRRSGGFNGAPTITVEYTQRRVKVTANLARFNGGANSSIQAIAVCLGAS